MLILQIIIRSLILRNAEIEKEIAILADDIEEVQLPSFESSKARLESEWEANRTQLRSIRRELRIRIQSLRESLLDLDDDTSNDLDKLKKTHVCVATGVVQLLADKAEDGKLGEMNIKELSFSR